MLFVLYCAHLFVNLHRETSIEFAYVEQDADYRKAKNHSSVS